jgi:hypothetical protein
MQGGMTMRDQFLFETMLRQICEAQKDDYIFPEMHTQGSYQSWNSGREEMARLGKFIELLKPSCIIECGTFEGWGTEFMASQMILHSSNPYLFTIDVPSIVDWNNGNYLPVYSSDFNHVLEVRKQRIQILESLTSSIQVKYVEGLIHEKIGEIVKERNPDFIYHDATHLAAAMAKDIHAAEEAGLKKWCIVCFDDVVPGHPFPELFQQEFKDKWIGKHLPEGRGQFWMQKMV